MNEARLAAAIPDSSLFDRDADLPRRKPKISLPPRRTDIPDHKPAAVEYFDVWGSAPPGESVSVPKSKPQLPTSADSYRSPAHVAPKHAPVPVPVVDPSIPAEAGEIDTGMGDTLEGDVLDFPPIDVKIPPPPSRKRNDIQINMHIPKYLPEDQKKKLVAEVRENRRKWHEAEALKHAADIEISKEEADEVLAQLEAEKSKPKPEKPDPLMRFIADEPAFEVEAVPASLSEAPAEPRPFARLQKSFEERRKVGLHE
jgi:hypothetical protein